MAVQQLEQALRDSQANMMRMQEIAAKEIDKAKNAGQADVSRKIFELEKMKLDQYDKFTELVADLQKQYAEGVGQIVQLLGEIKATNQPAPPAQQIYTGANR